MRAYEIVVTDPNNADKEVYKISSMSGGVTDFGALNIELDIPNTSYDTPWGGSFVRIWGIGLNIIGQSHNYNGMDIKIYAGMKKGLPLSNPEYYGLLVDANIFQAFGNWQGTSQSLDFILLPKTGSPSSPSNLELQWKKDTNLSDAIVSCLQVAFPSPYKVQSSVSTSIIASEDVTATYTSLSQLARKVKDYSKSIITTSGYDGVKIAYSNSSFYLFDGSEQPASTSVIGEPSIQGNTTIAFNELIGQPTWIEPSTIQFKTAMRKGIKVGDYVNMPNTLQTTTAQSQSQYRNRSAFDGKFMVRSVRHVGNFRQKDANSWVTVIEAFQTTNL